VIKDTLYTLVTRIFYIIGKILYSVIVNRALGPVGKGLFELIQLAPNVLTSFGTFGFNEANIYFAGRKPQKIPNILSNSYVLGIGFSIVAMLLGAAFIFLPQNRPIFDNIPYWVGGLALLAIPLGLIDSFVLGVLYGENRIWVQNVHEIIRIITQVLYIGVFVVILKLAVQGAVYGFVLINVTLLIFTLIVLSRFHKPVGDKFDKDLAWESWKFARFSWGANFAQYLLLKVDQWLILLLASEATRMAQVGLYSTAVNVITNIWIIPASIQTSLMPKITQKGESERKKLVPPSLRIVTIIVAIAIFVLAIIGKWALGFLYGNEWLDAYTPMILLIPGIFSMSFAKVFAADFFSRGKPYVSMYVSVFSLIINVILNFILIPRDWMVGTLLIGGMNGAAIASSVAYTLSFILFLILYVRESGEKSRNLFIPKRSDYQTIWSWLVISWNKLPKKNQVGDATDDREGTDV